MPWKGEKNPYLIWLSEVILQQTRVEQGIHYYKKFVAQYSSVHDLARAKDEDVFKLWEGLGYYNRCRNLLYTAREIVKRRNGVFPADYHEILSLKGVGPYTAAAIASFAYNLPYAVVDGNVFRLLARFYGIDTATDSTKGKQLFAGLAQQMLNKTHPGAYNQAIMDFGATICKPISPVCSDCVLNHSCAAFATGNVNRLPVKEKTLTRRTRYFTYFIFKYENSIWVQQRKGKDIWQNLFEFYLVETEKMQGWKEDLIYTWLKDQLGIQKASVTHISSPQVQQLTHQQIKGQFIHITLKDRPASLKAGKWQRPQSFRKLALPKFITGYLQHTNP